MIDEEDLVNAELAAKEPAQRFRFIERLANKRLDNDRDDNGNSRWDDFDYMSSILAAAEAFGIEELSNWRTPNRSDDGWRAECRNFRALANQVSQRILFEYASRPTNDPNSVALDEVTKQKLRFHLSQLRAAIDASAMPDWQKADFYDAITNLEHEIDKARTRIAAVFDVVAKAWKGDVDLPEAFRQVVVIIQDAKTREEAKALISPVQPKKLEGPKPNSLAAPKPKEKKKPSFDRPLDDEIPF